MTNPLPQAPLHFCVALLMVSSTNSLSAEPSVSPIASEKETAASARTEALLARELAMIRQGRLTEAERSFARKLASQRTPRDRAALMGCFAIHLFQLAPTLDDATSAKVLDYLERSVDGYRLVLGADHPEVATALIRRAEVERLLHPENPAPWTDLAYQQAYRIRSLRLGGTSLVTLSTLIPIAELKALPSRAKGDPAEIEAAADLLRQVIKSAAAGQDSQATSLHSDAVEALKRLDVTYGGGQPGARRPRIIAAPPQCATAGLSDAIVFSGEPGPLQSLRDSFRKARLDLEPCGSTMVFRLGPGVDPSPVLDLLTDISAGRMKGVRMGLGDESQSRSP
ncbi:MAG: hypothetical protein V4618_04530 [Pseudomonadota bacterium]